MDLCALKLVRSAVAATLLLAPGVAGAQGIAPGDAVSVELNKLEAAGSDCQATVVATNGPQRLASLKLDLVIFDAGGVVAKRIAAELGPLAARKTVVKTFAVKSLACTSISRVVLNDLMACTGPAGPVADCLDRLALTSRTPAVFTK